MKKVLVVVGVLAVLVVLCVGIAWAAKPSDDFRMDTIRGTVKAGSLETVTFNTDAEDTGVILTFKARKGGDRVLRVYDSYAALRGTITIPGEVTSGWSTYIAVNGNEVYTVTIEVSQGKTRYELIVRHCPEGRCF